MNRLLAISLIGLTLAVGCSKREALVLGQAPFGKPRTIYSIKMVGRGTPVVLDGIMVEKCPVAGCWFRLRDSTGTIKVDTRSAGFVVANVPVNSKLTVSGKSVMDGDDVAIEALGIRY
jgi:uncharacterized protein YdeI (BOF family)